MLSSAKNYIIAILGVIASIAIALMYRSKARYEGAMRKGVEQVRETEKKATQAMTKGLEREKKVRDEAKSAIANRTFFG
jgi:hypothetical protein